MGLKKEKSHPTSMIGDSTRQPAAAQVVPHDSLPMLGGPTANDENTGSRRNALKHGMTSSTLLPEDFNLAAWRSCAGSSFVQMVFEPKPS
jgi:hypothetical protein